MTFLQVQGIGNLGNDPEMRYLQDGTPVTNFSMAVNRKWNDAQGNKQEETTWLRISVWGRMAETCNQYLEKGKQVHVIGRLRSENGSPRIFTRQDGSAGASFEVTAEKIHFLNSANGGSYQTSQGQAGQEEDDIPF